MRKLRYFYATGPTLALIPSCSQMICFENFGLHSSAVSRRSVCDPTQGEVLLCRNQQKPFRLSRLGSMTNRDMRYRSGQSLTGR
jgi:hypothetical protein